MEGTGLWVEVLGGHTYSLCLLGQGQWEQELSQPGPKQAVKTQSLGAVTESWSLAEK